MTYDNGAGTVVTGPTVDPYSSGGGGTTSPGTTSPGPSDSGLTPEEQSARAVLMGTLDQYGLGSLADFVWKEHLAGVPDSQIFLDIRATPEYKARFPAMDTLAKAGHAISEAAYIDYERNAVSLMRAAGLPSGFYDQPDDFTALLSNQVALPELKQRLDDYTTLAFKSPPEVRAAYQEFYGAAGDGMLIASFIDPDRALPMLEKDFAAAQAGGYARSTGYGSLTKTQAEGLAQLGLDPSTYQAGFSNLASQSQALQGLPGWSESPISTETALAAQFGGNVAAQQEIERRQLDLVAPNKAGGQVATTQQGAVGAGAAR